MERRPANEMQTLAALPPRDGDLWEMYMTWQRLRRKLPLSLSSSLSSLSSSPPPPRSHRSCSGPGPLAAPAQKGPRSRLARADLTTLKGTLLLFKAQTLSLLTLANRAGEIP